MVDLTQQRTAELATAFITALTAGDLCLHPTDTLPGLTFDPSSVSNKDKLAALKQRDSSKPVLALCSDVGRAFANFAPLPGDWEARLTRLWPGPLSVIWRPAPGAPPALVAADGTIALRVPRLGADAAWFAEVLERWPQPLPTTSVNQSRQPAATRWAEAVSFVAASGEGFVPQLDTAPETFDTPSTLIRLHEDGGYEVLRLGAMSISVIEAAGNPA